jgi:hypothetical protein
VAVSVPTPRRICESAHSRWKLVKVGPVRL